MAAKGALTCKVNGAEPVLLATSVTCTVNEESPAVVGLPLRIPPDDSSRSEERRVGKEF
jgi:hypothetical protein